MSDLFRGRSSTWSAGAGVGGTTSDNPDNGSTVAGIAPTSSATQSSDRLGFGYSTSTVSAVATALALHSASTSPIDHHQSRQCQQLHSHQNPLTHPQNCGSNGGSFHYSPSATLGAGINSQEFSASASSASLPRRQCQKTTPSSSTETASDFTSGWLSSSPSRGGSSTRDWSAGFASASNFSVLSVAGEGASGPSGNGNGSSTGNSSLLPPSGAGGNGTYSATAVAASSPYTNGLSQVNHPVGVSALHSGSPSSASSQLSTIIGAPPTTTSAGNAATATSIPGATAAGAKRPARRNPWGSETYSDLIAKAIESYPDKQATLQQIYDYISTNYTYFRERSDPPASAGWKNSIRHNLSLHDKFVKCPKAHESSKSSYWRLNASSLNRPYVRRRTCSLDTPGSGGNGASSGGKKAKSRLGSTGSGLANGSASKRSIGKGSGIYSGVGLDDHFNNHFNRSAGMVTSAFSVPQAGGGGSGLEHSLLNHQFSQQHHQNLGESGSAGLLQQHGQQHNHQWMNSGSPGFLGERKMGNEELSALCKMHSSDLMTSGDGGGYDFLVPRVGRSNFPPSGNSTSNATSPPSAVASAAFFSPSSLASRYHHIHHPAFPPHQGTEQQSRYETSPSSSAYDQLTGILTGSAECLEGNGGDPFLRDEMQQMGHNPHSHHQQHQFQQQNQQMPSSTSSHLHNLLICGDASSTMGQSATLMPRGGGGNGAMIQEEQPISSQDAMELRISLEIANRVKSGEMSSTMQQWAAAAAARTVENGV